MRNSEQRPVFVLTVLALVVGILTGAIGMALLRPPGEPVAKSELKAEQPVSKARHAAGAIERPQARNEPADPQVGPAEVSQPQPLVQEEPNSTKQPSAWDLLTPERKEAERWKEVRRVSRKPELSDLEAREAYFKLPFSIKLQMEYELTKDERFARVIELHRTLAKSDFAKKLLATQVPWHELFSAADLEKIANKVRGENVTQTTDESLFYLGRMEKGEVLSILEQSVDSPVIDQMIKHRALAEDIELRRLLYFMERKNSSTKFNVFADTQPPPATIWPMLVDNAFEAYPRS